MKYAIVTVSDFDFLKGAQVMIYSFLLTNKWFRGDLILLTVNTPKKVIRDKFLFADNLKIKYVSRALYNKVDAFCDSLPNYCTNRQAFYRLDLFSLKQYSRIMYVDSDILFKGDVKEVFEKREFFIASLDKPSYKGWCRRSDQYVKIVKEPEVLIEQLRWMNTFNAGIFWVDKSLLSKRIFNELLGWINEKTYIKYGGGQNEQFLLNLFFKEKYKTISGKYNYRMQIGSDIKRKDKFVFKEVKVIHFTGGIKPWHTLKIFHNIHWSAEYRKAYLQWYITFFKCLRRNMQLKVNENLGDFSNFLKAISIKKYKQIDTFIFFIGYSRSGHTLIGALLDAHRNCVIATELDVFRLREIGFSKQQIFNLIIKRSKEMMRKSYVWTDYNYKVPNQYQGKQKSLKAMGVKHGGKLAKLLEEKPGLLNQFKEFAPNIKLVHICRNPFDIITTRVNRQETSQKRQFSRRRIMEQIHIQFGMVEVVNKLKTGNNFPIFDLYHEDFIADPKFHLTELCKYLGLEPFEDYIHDCSSIVFKKPTATRYRVDWWDDELKEMVNSRIAKYDFLKRYSF